MTASIKLNVHFMPGTSSHRVLRKGRKPEYVKITRLPRITRLMALAVKYEHLRAKHLVGSHQELANLAGVDRSHISRVMRLRLLAPTIQEWLLNLPETECKKDPLCWEEFVHLTRITCWEEQEKKLHRLIPDHYPICRAKGFDFADGAPKQNPEGELE